MQKKTRLALVAGAAVLALTGAGAAVVGATTGGDDDGDDTPITGTDLEQASAAALAHVGEGRVTGTEVGDEESYYEVEVTRDDGSQIDVQLDQSFHVVAAADDAEDTGADEGGDD